MRKYLRNWSILSALVAGNVALALTYLGLVAFSMSYAALEVEFSQSVKDDQASVATLDARYLAQIARITQSDPTAAGYAAPVAERYVPAAPATALNLR
ncbi:MAG TPA: hypothetical protein VHC68_01960 [Candidatus Paceibacterota bacterium]|nr:hypothetical protein [Candidatus Paceibacterota bacterium]